MRGIYSFWSNVITEAQKKYSIHQEMFLQQIKKITYSSCQEIFGLITNEITKIINHVVLIESNFEVVNSA